MSGAFNWNISAEPEDAFSDQARIPDSRRKQRDFNFADSRISSRESSHLPMQITNGRRECDRVPEGDTACSGELKLNRDTDRNCITTGIHPQCGSHE